MAWNPTAIFSILGRNRSKQAFAEVKQGLDGIRTTGLSVGKALGFAGGIGSLAGFTSLARQAAGFAAELSNASDKLGLNTEFLQTWTYAADRFDISSSAALIALQRFSRRSAEAAAGGGELAKVFAELGIETRTADGAMRPVEALLRDYADAISEASTESEQLRLAFKAFDSEGAALVSILRDGAAALDEYRAKASEAGQLMSDPDIQALADAEKQLEDLQKRLTIFAGRLTAAGIQAGKGNWDPALDMYLGGANFMARAAEYPYVNVMRLLGHNMGFSDAFAGVRELGANAVTSYGPIDMPKARNPRAVADPREIETAAALQNLEHTLKLIEVNTRPIGDL